ncbi:uridine diphosphate-N-acetylglucosamine-binding protein YvcK [Aliibacillus thermotolerans]|uniref:Gluconeogenesis factor n=1 Tax=Aliibacillus thermotolerans TaxID=1834418 RepID=A0ABW0U5C2_9BACI|nr:YvcK family protein [Aliibacillus thermotolerans]MDA3128721.1 uridine diphosphate-N-acetylglucosamine-binding protein YvcK [Aliibacillus thermotolerans]
MKNIKTVVIGGGTGLSVLLKGLKKFPMDITAIVTVADDGGSSGRIRKELNIPPPGDVRNVLIALAEVEPMFEKLFQHRFENGTELRGHSLGNLLLAGMTSITGDFARGISELSTVLNVRGKVLPAANQSVELHAKMSDGTVIHGESSIPKAGKKIERVFLTPPTIEALPESLEAIRDADIIVLGPGSLYTSVIPNLLVPGISETIRTSQGKTAYICNAMTQAGETEGFTAFDHVQAIHDHAGEIIDTVLVHDGPIPAHVRKRYEEEHATPVLCDDEKLRKLGCDVLKGTFVDAKENVRHDPEKVAQSLLSIL